MVGTKKRELEEASDFERHAKKARIHAPRQVEDVKRYLEMDFFRYYVQQMAQKHLGSNSGLHPFVKDHAWPPVDINAELNMRFVRNFLMKKQAGKDKTMQVILQGAFWGPDQPFCFKEVLPSFLKGLDAHRRDGWRKLKKGGTNIHFDEMQRVIQRRYVRGIDKKLILSGQRKGTVYGLGDKGIYNAEHQTSIMPGKTHPEGLRWKLEHWPYWLEYAVVKQIESWPSADNPKAIQDMLKSKYQKDLPEGALTKISVGFGNPKKTIVDLFGGDEKFALSTLSQALLFREIMSPKDDGLKNIRKRYGLGAGTFTVRGFWLAYHRSKTFPAIDTQTFCPGFVGAVGGAESIGLGKFVKIKLAGDRTTISWDRWETQIRFAAWLYSLQQYMVAAEKENPCLRDLLKRSGFKSPMHFTELEAHLCFCKRLVTMFMEDKGSKKWSNAAKAIGSNLPPAEVKELFRNL